MNIFVESKVIRRGNLSCSRATRMALSLAAAMHVSTCSQQTNIFCLEGKRARSSKDDDLLASSLAQLIMRSCCSCYGTLSAFAIRDLCDGLGRVRRF